METLEFLGGKYQKTEQIVPGPVQTFRARESATGREVFVHRVSTTEEPAEQVALLRMLTAVLLRSTEARRLVLDFGDEQGFWYVVTQSEPRCLILREWLQFELHSGDSAVVAAKPAPSTPDTSLPTTPAKPEESAPGEFTKLFQASPPTALKAPPPAGPVAAAPEKRATPPEQPVQSEPGEFTRIFQSFKSQPAQPTSAASSPAPPPNAEPGEFTKIFQSGLPAGSKAPSTPEIKRSHDRPSRGGFVQRPNTPMPPLPQKSAESGEFTRIFSHPSGEGAKSNDVFAGYPSSTTSPRDFLSAELPKPRTAESHEPGEYTRIFGGGTVSPPIEQPAPPMTTKSPIATPADDPLLGTRHFEAAPPAPAPVQKGPSEYTMIVQGNRPVEAGGTSNTAPAAGNPPPAPPALPKIPAPPQLKVPQVSAPKPPAPAQVKIATPTGNKKLIVFFGILVILAVILVLLVVLIAVKK